MHQAAGDAETIKAFLLAEIRQRGLIVKRIGDVNDVLGRIVNRLLDDIIRRAIEP